MPSDAGEMLIEKPGEIRRRLDRLTLQAERDYWMKVAEGLQDDLQKIFDDAKTVGKVTLRYGSEVICLQTERS